jgi:hypothetical protein
MPPFHWSSSTLALADTLYFLEVVAANRSWIPITGKALLPAHRRDVDEATSWFLATGTLQTRSLSGKCRGQSPDRFSVVMGLEREERGRSSRALQP